MDFKLSEEQTMLIRLARDLGKKEFEPHNAEWDQNQSYPAESFSRMFSEIGLLGMTIPEEYGGHGRPYIDFILIIEELAKYSIPACYSLMGSNDATVSTLIALGSDEMKQRYLPRLVAGEVRCAVAMTEPEAGSAMTDLKTKAEDFGDYYVINGSKCFVGDAGEAELHNVYVRFGDTPGSNGIGAIIIEKGTPGFSLGKDQRLMGMRYRPRRELFFDDCRVPKANVLVQPGQFRKLMGAFNAERLYSAAMCLGISERALEFALEYSKMRKVFGRELCELQGIQWMLADMKIELEAARWLIYKVGTEIGSGFLLEQTDPPVLDTSIAKTFINQAGLRIVDTAIQIHGAYGYSEDLPLERMYRDIRGLCIGGGTVQVNKNTIAAQMLGRKVHQRRT